MSITNPNQISGLIAHYHVDDIPVSLKVDGSQIKRWANRANPRLPLRSYYGGYNWPIAASSIHAPIINPPTWDSAENCIKFNSPSTANGQALWCKFGNMNLSGLSVFVRVKKRVQRNATDLCFAWGLGININYCALNYNSTDMIFVEVGENPSLQTSIPSPTTSTVFGLVQSPGTNSPTFLTVNGVKSAVKHRWITDYRTDFVLGGQWHDPATFWTTEVTIYNRVLTDPEISDISDYMGTDHSVPSISLSPVQLGAKSWWFAGSGRSEFLWTDLISGKNLILNNGSYNTPCTDEIVSTLPAAGFNNTCMIDLQSTYDWLNTGCATAIITGDLSHAPGSQRNIFDTFPSGVGQAISKNGAVFTATNTSGSGQTVTYSAPSAGADVVGMSHGLIGYAAFCNDTYNKNDSFSPTANNTNLRLGANPTNSVTNLDNMKVVDFILFDYDITEVEYSWLKSYLQGSSRTLGLSQVSGLIAHYHIDDIHSSLKVHNTQITRWPNRVNPRYPLRQNYGSHNWSIPNTGASQNNVLWDSSTSSIKFQNTANNIMWTSFDGMLTHRTVFIRFSKVVSNGGDIRLASFGAGAYVQPLDNAWMKNDGGIGFGQAAEECTISAGSRHGVSGTFVMQQSDRSGFVQWDSIKSNVSTNAGTYPKLNKYFMIGNMLNAVGEMHVKEILIYDRSLSDQEISQVNTYLADSNSAMPQFISMNPSQAKAIAWWASQSDRLSTTWVDRQTNQSINLNSGPYNTQYTTATKNSIQAAVLNDTCLYNNSGLFGVVDTGYASVITVGDFSNTPPSSRNITDSYPFSQGHFLQKSGGIIIAGNTNSNNSTVTYTSGSTIDVIGYTHGAGKISAFCNTVFGSSQGWTQTAHDGHIRLGGNPTVGPTPCLPNMTVTDFVILDYDITQVELSWFNNYFSNSHRPIQTNGTPNTLYGMKNWWDHAENFSSGVWYGKNGGRVMKPDTVYEPTAVLPVDNSQYLRFSNNSSMTYDGSIQHILSRNYTLVMCLKPDLSIVNPNNDLHTFFVLSNYTAQSDDVGRSSFMRQNSGGSNKYNPYFGTYLYSGQYITNGFLTSPKSVCVLRKKLDGMDFWWGGQSISPLPAVIDPNTYLTLGKVRYDGGVFDLYHFMLFDRSLSNSEIYDINAWFSGQPQLDTAITRFFDSNFDIGLHGYRPVFFR